MKAYRKIKNPKLYCYLKRYKNSIINTILDEDNTTESPQELEINYLKMISKIDSFEEIPAKWLDYIEEIETKKIVRRIV